MTDWEKEDVIKGCAEEVERLAASINRNLTCAGNFTEHLPDGETHEAAVAMWFSLTRDLLLRGYHVGSLLDWVRLEAEQIEDWRREVFSSPGSGQPA